MAAMPPNGGALRAVRGETSAWFHAMPGRSDRGMGMNEYQSRGASMTGHQEAGMSRETSRRSARRGIGTVAAALVVTMIAASSRATPFRVPVNAAQSSVTVELCIDGQIFGVQCDTDTSPVVGGSQWKVDSLSNPTMLTVYAFNLALTEQIDLDVNFSIFGGIDVIGQNIAMAYQTPFVPQPPVAINATNFDYPGIPTAMSGTINYDATGLVCTALSDGGLPCSDMVDLSQQGSGFIDITGTISINPTTRVVTMLMNPDVLLPISPTDPDAGSLHITGTIVGSVTLPLHGDANLDGVVDGRDIQLFVATLVNPDQGWQRRYAVDMNDDDSFDIADVALFVDLLLIED